MTVLRYGHLRSAPVVVDVGLRTEWEPPTLRAALWLSTRFGASSMDTPDVGASSMASFLSSDLRDTTSPEGRERCRMRSTQKFASNGGSVDFPTWSSSDYKAVAKDYVKISTPWRAAHGTAPPRFAARAVPSSHADSKV